jgi:molybdopterin synthase sulfur carrier subunit
MPTIRIPGALRTLTAGNADVSVNAATVRAALEELERKHPGIAAKLLDGKGAVKPFIKIYVGAEDIGGLSGLDTSVGERDEIDIIPAIAGGRDA